MNVHVPGTFKPLALLGFGTLCHNEAIPAMRALRLLHQKSPASMNMNFYIRMMAT